MDSAKSIDHVKWIEGDERRKHWTEVIGRKIAIELANGRGGRDSRERLIQRDKLIPPFPPWLGHG
jgi:hypothetical protein